MTNPKEGAYLNSKKGQVGISNSIFNAILKYKKTINFSEQTNIGHNQKNELIYKVQIAAGKRRIELKSYNFKGLKNISRIKDGLFYKYFYSNSTSLDDIKKKKKYVRLNGYPNAYIVGFKNGKLFDVD